MRFRERASRALPAHRVLRVGEETSKLWVGHFPGVGGVFHEERYEVKGLANAGCQVLGITDSKKSPPKSKLLRDAREVFGGSRMVSERRAFLHLLNAEAQHRSQLQGEAPRLTLIGSSYAFWSITRIARDDPQAYSPIRSLVGLAPGFGSFRHLSLLERLKRSLGANRALAQARSLAPVLGEVLQRFQIPVSFLVPLAEHTVDNAATEEAFDRLGPNVEKTAILLPETPHDLFGSMAQTEMRRYAMQVLQSICRGEDLPEPIDPGIRIIRGDQPWGI